MKTSLQNSRAVPSPSKNRNHEEETMNNQQMNQSNSDPAQRLRQAQLDELSAPVRNSDVANAQPQAEGASLANDSLARSAAADGTNEPVGSMLTQQGVLRYQHVINQQRLMALQGGASLASTASAHLMGIGGGGFGGLNAMACLGAVSADLASVIPSYTAGLAGGLASSTLGGGLGVPGISNLQQLNPYEEAATTNRLLQLQGLRGAAALERLQYGARDGARSSTSWSGNTASGQVDPYAEMGLLGPWSATSAGLLGSMAASNSVEKTKKVRKKAKDKPKRPLSAYNVFFKEERSRLLEERKQKSEAKISDDKKKGGSKNAKIGFESLAKVIGHRWQELTSDQVEYYKKKADEDMVRYKREMEAWNAANKAKGEKDGGSTKRTIAADTAETDAPETKKARVAGGETS